MALSQAALELLITMKDEATSGLSSLGGALKTVGGVALGVAAGGVAAFGAAVVSGMADAREAAGIMAQTQAVIKSTGGAAGFTADQIADMASSMSDAAGQSLFGDTDIQQGQNLLLTFTNIKETLPEATGVMVDMAQAMDTDVKGGAIQLGKALNDPIAGISALSRVGVTFTEEQKAQIAAMQQAGDTAGAQRVILAELNKEFGGSAAAAAAATGGWSEFQGRIGEAKETLGAAVLPLLNSLAGVLNSTVLPAVEAGAQAFATIVGTLQSGAEGGVGSFIASLSSLTGIDLSPIVGTLQSLMVTFTDSATPVEGFLNVLSRISPTFDLVRGIVEAALPPIQAIVLSVFGIISGFIQEHGATILADVTSVWNGIQGIIDGVLPPIQQIIATVFGAIAAFLAENGADIQAFLGDAWDQIAAIIKIAVALVQAIIVPVFQFIASFISQHGDTITRLLTDAWQIVKSVIDAALTIIRGVLTAALQIIQGDWSGAWETIKGTASRVWEDIKGVLSAGWDTIVALLGGFAAEAVNLGSGIINGVVDGISSAASKLADMVGDAVGDAISAGKRALHDAGVPGFASGVTNFGGGLALVGERGPELVALPRGSNVYPAGQTRQMLAGGGGGSVITIGQINTYAAPGQTPEQITDVTLRELRRRTELRRT